MAPRYVGPMALRVSMCLIVTGRPDRGRAGV